MSTDYNLIAEQYKQCKEHPWRSRIETYSIMKHLGNLEGKKVLDVACGEGFYARKLRHWGAGEVVGIDLSEAMIRLALDQEERHPLGITYRVEGCLYRKRSAGVRSCNVGLALGLCT